MRSLEMSYLTGACGVARWNCMSNENVYERFGMRRRGSGVGCVVVEWVRRSTLRLFGHIERMENVEFVKKVYLSNVEGPSRRGRPLGILEDRVKAYMSERGVRQGGSVWIERWGSFCHGHPLGGCSRRERVVRAID